MVLSEFLRTKETEESIFEKVIEMTCKKFYVSRDDILGNKRTANIAGARHFAVYVLRKTTTYSQKKIAELMGRKDHSTIINSIDIIEKKIHTDSIFAGEVSRFIEELTLS